MPIPVRRRVLFVASCAGMSAFGFSLVLLGTLFGFPEVRERLHVDVLKQGGLSSLLILGMFVSTCAVGPLIDRFGNKFVLTISSFTVAIAFTSFALVDSFAQAAFCAVLLGIGGGGLNTSTNVVVSEIYPENRGAMLNVLAIFFGLGAVAVPFIAARLSPGTAITVGASYATLCGIVYVFMSFPPAREAHGFALESAIKVVTYPGVLLIGMILFFESANEQVTHTFASTWVGAAGAAPRVATFALVGYMGAMAIGRIFVIRLLRSIPKKNVVILNSFGALLGTSILFNSHSAAGVAVGIVVAGLGYSSIFPTVLAIAGDRYQRFAGTVFGTLFAISLAGAFVAPSCAGYLGKRYNVHLGTVVPMLGALAVLVLILVFRRGEKRAESAHELEQSTAQR